MASFQHLGISPEALIPLNMSSNTISESFGICLSSFIWTSGCVMRLFQSITKLSYGKLYIVVFRVVNVNIWVFCFGFLLIFLKLCRVIVAAGILVNFLGKPICYIHSLCYFCPLFSRWCIVVLLCLPFIFLIISHTFFAGAFTFNFDTYSCHNFL